MTFWGSNLSLVVGVVVLSYGAFSIGRLQDPFSLQAFITAAHLIMILFGAYIFGVWFCLRAIRSGEMKRYSFKGNWL